MHCESVTTTSYLLDCSCVEGASFFLRSLSLPVQSAAAVAHQHRTSAALAQVQQVQQQMRTIKQQAGGGGGGGGGGQTLNPHLW